jgi:hypothetical protein
MYIISHIYTNATYPGPLCHNQWHFCFLVAACAADRVLLVFMLLTSSFKPFQKLEQVKSRLPPWYHTKAIPRNYKRRDPKTWHRSIKHPPELCNAVG